MPNLDLTIVVPTYNLGHYLSETLKSIQQQTIDFEKLFEVSIDEQAGSL